MGINSSDADSGLFFSEILQQYGSLKRTLSSATGAPEDLLHLHMGLLVFIFFALVLRRRMASAWPLAAVVAFAILNEIVDYVLVVGAGDPWSLSEAGFDIVNTIFWPGLLFLLARRGGGAKKTRVP